MVNDKFIRLRSWIKKKKPDFKQDGYREKKRVRNNDRWRRPVGSQSKMRLGKKGQPLKRKSGFSSPRKVRGTLKNGLKPLLIYNSSQLEDFDNEHCSAVIASSVGMKKRVEIVKKAIKNKIDIHNIKNAEAYLKKVEEELKKRKELHKKKVIPKKSEKKAEEKPKPKKDIEEKVDEVEKKKEEKKEWDKMLTQK